MVQLARVTNSYIAVYLLLLKNQRLLVAKLTNSPAIEPQATAKNIVSGVGGPSITRTTIEAA